MQTHLTVGEVATLYGVPTWRIRRLVDSLDVDIPRAGRYRLIPRFLLVAIAVELQKAGCVTGEASPCPK